MIYTKVPEDILVSAKIFGDKINKLKASYDSSNFMNLNSHEVSKIGEWLVAFFFELEDQINWEIQPEGDKGYDLDLYDWKVDVKTTTYFEWPELKCYPKELNTHANLFILVGYQSEEESARLVGFISKQKLLQHYEANWRNLGPRYIVNETQLCKKWSLLSDSRPF